MPMEQDSRPVLQVPSRILAPALRLHPSTASAFSHPVDMTTGSRDRGVDMSTREHSETKHQMELDSSRLLNEHHFEEPSTSSQRNSSNKKNKKCLRKIDARPTDRSESANSPDKMQVQRHEPRTKLSFSVDSIIAKVTKYSDEEDGEYDRNNCDTRSSSPGSPESERHAKERAVTPDADVQQSGERSYSPREHSPRPSSREDSHHAGDFSLFRPSALPPGLAGLPYPFSPVGLGLSPWPGLSAAYPSMFPAGPAPSTSTLPKLSSPESEYMVLYVLSEKFVIDCSQYTSR